MNLHNAFGFVLITCSCWPVWHGLATLADRDYLATALTLGLAWVLARTGVELVGLGETRSQRPVVRSTVERQSGQG